jgi:hypothetical protein
MSSNTSTSQRHSPEEAARQGLVGPSFVKENPMLLKRPSTFFDCDITFLEGEHIITEQYSESNVVRMLLHQRGGRSGNDTSKCRI